ncbi:MAG: L-serine ammonia-lyase, iron-sulfur-dependent, subunit alpha [Lachnospiraceae bacterium]|nr:L-serine ammonia-lyase, iron-sulfur-dependent, subunit alpha [Lachnospiraceae bacterium]
MIELYPEFYNDVFGPIMQPGSSSHMAAPCRAGYLCNSLLGEEVAEILVELDNDGSFKGTFGTMNEDLGMLNGAMGHLPDYKGFFQVKANLKSQGIPYKFDFCTMKESPHINSLKFIITGVSGKQATLVANSIGGGMIETVWANGYSFVGKGDTYVLCVFDRERALATDVLAAKISAVQPVLECGMGEGQNKIDEQNPEKGYGIGVMHWFKIDCALTEDAKAVLDGIAKEVSGIDYAVMKPILPVPTTSTKKPQLYKDMVEWRRLAAEQGKTLPEVAIDYEMAASGWDREQVVAYMRDTIMPAMYRRTHALYEEDVTPITTPFTELHYKKWHAAMPTLPLNMGVISKSIQYVMAGQPPVEGVLNVPGPMGTGGGFIFGVLSAVQETLDLPQETLLRGLFVAAGVGAICYTRSAPTGEVTGCTGECGCCSAMAAAAVAEMLGGTPEQVEAAASMALQASVGWPCDPIPGGKDMPCMARVLFVATMSIVYAQWALAGQDPVLPFHEVLDVADTIGRGLSGDLLCTARGGHCAAPTAKKLACSFREWHSKQ